MIGICLNWGFMGVLVVQICKHAHSKITVAAHRHPFSDFYHLTFRQDPRAIRFLGNHICTFILTCLNVTVSVYGLFLLDIAQTCLVTADAFHWFVFGFGNMVRLDDTFLNSWDVPFLDAVIATIVQTFYCWRIWILTKSLVFPILIFLVRSTLLPLPLPAPTLHNNRSLSLNVVPE